MLLLKALHQLTKDESIKRNIERYLNFSDTDKSKLRLKPIEKDKEALEYVMNKDYREFMGHSNITDNYRFLLTESKKVLQGGGISVEAILNALERLQIAVISLEQNKGDEPQMVFERINATGLHLKGLDLIRNFLMMQYPPEEQERLFKEFWAKIEEILDDEKIVEAFVIIYLRIYYGTNFKEKNEDEIYIRFKQLRKDEFEDDSEKILLDMIKFARIYKIITNENTPWQYETSNSKEKRVLRDKIKLINDLQFGTAFPFLMQLIDDVQNDRLDFENFNEILNLLISFYVRRTVCSLQTNALAKMLYPAYKKIKDNLNADNFASYLGQKSGNEIFPNNVMLLRNLETMDMYKSKKVTSLILYEIEKLTNKEIPDYQSLNIEHFYPQTPTEEWRKMLGDEEAANLEQNYLHIIGNLTLINKDLNPKISNKSFELKVKMYEDYGSLHLNRHFGNCDKWGIDEIKARTNKLFEQFLQIEIFKDLKDEFRRTKESITLESNWRNLKPQIISFPNGDVEKISKITDLARLIIKYLINNHPQELDEALKQGLSCIHFGETQKIPGFMIEDFQDFTFVSNGAAESIRSNVKKLVEACGLDANEFQIV